MRQDDPVLGVEQAEKIMSQILEFLGLEDLQQLDKVGDLRSKAREIQITIGTCKQGLQKLDEGGPSALQNPIFATMRESYYAKFSEAKVDMQALLPGLDNLRVLPDFVDRHKQLLQAVREFLESGPVVLPGVAQLGKQSTPLVQNLGGSAGREARPAEKIAEARAAEFQQAVAERESTRETGRPAEDKAVTAPVLIEANLLEKLEKYQKALDMYVRTYIACGEWSAQFADTRKQSDQAQARLSPVESDWQQTLIGVGTSLSKVALPREETSGTPIAGIIEDCDATLREAKDLITKTSKRSSEPGVAKEAIARLSPSIDQMRLLITQLEAECKNGAENALKVLGETVASIIVAAEQKRQRQRQSKGVPSLRAGQAQRPDEKVARPKATLS